MDYSNPKKKPEVILSYNFTKAGVDTGPQLLCQTRRWPVVVFYNMVDISALNAYIVWSSLHPTDFARKAHKHRQFLLALGKELGGIEKDVPTESILIDTEEPPRKK